MDQSCAFVGAVFPAHTSKISTSSLATAPAAHALERSIGSSSRRPQRVFQTHQRLHFLSSPFIGSAPVSSSRHSAAGQPPFHICAVSEQVETEEDAAAAEEKERLRREEIENRLGPHIRGKMFDAIAINTPVAAASAMEFFERSSGDWSSWRVTHHLAFRRIETGASEVKVQMLGKDDPKIIELCKMHDMDPELAAGGAYVSWKANMQWDQEGDSHDGETNFAIVADPDDPRKGKMLRDRGYAEKMAVAGDFYLDENDHLILITEYEHMSVHERLFFDGEDRRFRTSTVKMYGGFTTATIAVEARPITQEDGTRVRPFDNNAEFDEILEKAKTVSFMPFPPPPGAKPAAAAPATTAQSTSTYGTGKPRWQQSSQE